MEHASRTLAEAPWLKQPGVWRPEEVRKQAAHWARFAAVAREVLAGRFGDSVLLLRHEELPVVTVPAWRASAERPHFLAGTEAVLPVAG